MLKMRRGSREMLMKRRLEVWHGCLGHFTAQMPSAVGVFDDPLFFSLWGCKGCFPYGHASGRGRLVARAAVWAALFSPIHFLAHLELTTDEKLAFFHRPSSQQNASSRTFSSASCFSVESNSLTGSATCLPSCQIPSRVGRGTPSISSKLRKRCLHFAFSNGLTPRRRRRA